MAGYSRKRIAIFAAGLPIAFALYWVAYWVGYGITAWAHGASGAGWSAVELSHNSGFAVGIPALLGWVLYWWRRFAADLAESEVVESALPPAASAASSPDLAAELAKAKREIARLQAEVANSAEAPGPVASEQACPACNRSNPSEARFCRQCGAPFSKAP